MAREIFISHSSIQKDWVEILGQNLVRAGFPVFIDRWNLTPGKSWLTQLDEALARCKAAILVVTREAIDSGWVREEYEKLRRRTAEEKEFPLIPVILDGVDADFPFLGNIHYVDFRSGKDYSEAFARLIAGLEGREPGPNPKFPGPITIPTAEQKIREMAPLGAREEPIAAKAVKQLTGNRFVAVFATGLSGHGDLAFKISDAISNEPSMGQVTRLHLPYVSGITSVDDFDADLNRQLGCFDMVAFAETLKNRMNAGSQFVFVIDGIEHVDEANRNRFCKDLRSLADEGRPLRSVFVGGSQLQDLKYSQGALSVLAGAEEVFWPNEPRPAKLIEDESWSSLSTEIQTAILEAAGDDAELALELARNEPESAEEAIESVAGSQWLMRVLMRRVRNDQTKGRLSQLVQQEEVGAWQAYLLDDTVRWLFWNGLVIREGRRKLKWRSHAVQQGVVSCLQQLS